MTEAGVERGLIGPREVGRVWERHILNSANLAGLLPSGSTMVDVGSGAGLPGLPLAILRPDLTVVLLEPLLRRSDFLREVVSGLALGPRIEVVRARAEDHHARYDTVVSRAVAPLARLVPWCAPLRNHSGVILAVKGRSAPEEVESAAGLISDAGLSAEVVYPRIHPELEPTTVVRLAAAWRLR